MEQIVITSSSSSGLNKRIEYYINNGWFPVGSHQVVVTHIQNRYSGTQHMDSIHSLEFSQTMRKEKDEQIDEN